MVIIALLCPLIFSVIGKVRQLSQATSCASNLRQCGVALNLYATNNGGYFPAALEADLRSWAVELSRGGYLPRLEEDMPSVAVCPSGASQGDYKDFRRVYGMWCGNADTGMYQFNRDVPCYRLSLEKLEANRIILADSGRCEYAEAWDQSYFIQGGKGKRESNSSNKVIKLAHNGKANVVFADGHLEAVDAEYLVRDGRYNWTEHDE